MSSAGGGPNAFPDPREDLHSIIGAQTAMAIDSGVAFRQPAAIACLLSVRGSRQYTMVYSFRRSWLALPNLRIERSKAAHRVRRARYTDDSFHIHWLFHFIHPSSIVALRSEEHTSELQSQHAISYAVFCLKKTKYKMNKKSVMQSLYLVLIISNT